jgi:tetratricopeptide (TPR) repeat protein
VADDLVRSLPDSADALGASARAHFNLGNFETAVTGWQRCLELNPKDAKACYGIAFVAAGGGDPERAVEMFKRASALDPADFRIPPLLGDELMKLGRFKEAAMVLESHVRGPVTSPLALTTLGKAYLQLEQYEDARAAFESAVAAAPDTKAAWYGLATACARLGEQDEAKRCRQRFAALDSEHLQQHSERLIAYGDAASTREVLTRVHLDAGRQYLKHGKTEKAEHMLQKASLLAPDNVEPYRELLTFYEETGRDREALEACRELCRLQPDHGEHWLNIGLLSGRLGDFEEAVVAAKRAIEIDPQNPKYREIYEAIQKGK